MPNKHWRPPSINQIPPKSIKGPQHIEIGVQIDKQYTLCGSIWPSKEVLLVVTNEIEY